MILTPCPEVFVGSGEQKWANNVEVDLGIRPFICPGALNSSYTRHVLPESWPLPWNASLQVLCSLGFWGPSYCVICWDPKEPSRGGMRLWMWKKEEQSQNWGRWRKPFEDLRENVWVCSPAAGIKLPYTYAWVIGRCCSGYEAGWFYGNQTCRSSSTQLVSLRWSQSSAALPCPPFPRPLFFLL